MKPLCFIGQPSYLLEEPHQWPPLQVVIYNYTGFTESCRGGGKHLILNLPQTQPRSPMGSLLEPSGVLLLDISPQSPHRLPLTCALNA